MKVQLLIAATTLMISNVFAQTFTNYTTSDGLLDNNVNCVDVDASGNVWFGTQGGVSMFTGSIWNNYTTSNSPGLADNMIQAIYVAENGNIWAGTDFGVSYLSGGLWTTYTTADGLGNNQVKCIAEDANGDLWFGTNTGVSKLSGSSWTSYGTGDGLPFGGVTTITEHSNGDLWMGSGLGGVIIFDGTNFSFLTTNDGLIDDRIRGLVIDDQNHKWVGTSEGITVMNENDAFSAHHTTIFTLPQPDTLNPIEDIKIDSQGNIWAGVYVDYLVTEGGVCAYDGNQWIEYHVADGLVGPVVRALAIDANDDVWVATSTGVSHISDHMVSLKELTSETFNVYPNPAKDVITIDLVQFDESGVVELYSMAMQKVKFKAFTSDNSTVTLNINDLDAGVYMLKVNDQARKVVLQ